MAVSAAAVGAGPVVRFHAASLAGAGEAAAGDCFLTDDPQHVDCLPSLINIGAQKAGTGEIQQWLSVHPQVHVHGAEVHFFDGVRGGRTRRCRSQREAKRMRLKYARHLWRQKALSRSDVVHKLIFEKTPAYLDLASPALVSCLVPATRLLLMLRMPVARAVSAYDMCQLHSQLKQCSQPFHVAVAPYDLDGLPRFGEMERGNPRLYRLLHMGAYAHHIERWLKHFPSKQLRILWLEQFKADPFRCMAALERFLGLRAIEYRDIATKGPTGLWVVGASKSITERKFGPRPKLDQELNRTLHRFYEPWQERLRMVIAKHNLTLVHRPSPPLL